MAQAERGASSLTVRRRDIRVAERPSRSVETAAAIARAVLEHGPVARSTVARVAGLSTATVSVVAGRLVEAGVLREAPEAVGPRSSAGRPHVPLDIDTERTAVVGIHLAVPCFTVSLLDLRGRVLVAQRVPYADDRPDPDVELPRVARAVDDLVAEAGDRRVVGLGAAAGGRVDPERGVLVEHPVLGWRDVSLGDMLARATGLQVAVDGHTRSLLRAERLFGEVRVAARRSVVQLFVGNVVDVAFAVGDTVHHGPRMAAGRIAHLPVEGCDVPCACGRSGCLQAAVSERSLVRRAVAAGIVEEPDVRLVVAAAEAGDPYALGMLHERARLVGRAAGTLLDLFNPEVLLVQEIGVNRLPALRETLRAEVLRGSEVAAERDLAATVRPSSFPLDALAVAGGTAFLGRLYDAPLDAMPLS